MAYLWDAIGLALALGFNAECCADVMEGARDLQHGVPGDDLGKHQFVELMGLPIGALQPRKLIPVPCWLHLLLDDPILSTLEYK